MGPELQSLGGPGLPLPWPNPFLEHFIISWDHIREEFPLFPFEIGIPLWVVSMAG